MLKCLFREADGQVLTEYGLLMFLIAITCLLIVTVFGATIRNLFIHTFVTLGAIKTV